MADCNRCTLDDIRSGHRDERVVVRDNQWGGVDVFVGPTTLTEDAIASHRERYFVAWFMELPERCAC